MHNSYFKTFKSEAVFNPYLIVKAGTVPGTTITVAAAATDKLLGVTDSIATKVGDDVDVNLMGQHSVTLGGIVAFWDPLTSNGNGQAITASAGNNIIGYAMKAGVAGDVITYLGIPGQA